MKPITVRIVPQPISYEIEFCEQLTELVKQLKGQISERNFLMITDENLFEIFKNQIFKYFPNEKIHCIPPGEKSKAWPTIEKILNTAFKQNLDRGSVFISVGGGVVGDLTGFAASVFLRGISVIHIPTSLLAVVDASIGGKTGIDSQFGKNLIGSLHQPEKIFCCHEFLSKLPTDQIRWGLAEMVKHGIIASEHHFAELEKIADPNPDIEKVWPLISDSIRIKASMVETDVRGLGERMKLSLGHTFGHAIELLSHFKIPHGRAVAIGTMMAVNYAVEKGICMSETADRIENIFHKFGMDLLCDFSEKEIWDAMQHDKKRKDGKLRLILPKKIGEVVTFEL